MRTIGTIETGILNQFGSFYQNLDFFNQGDEELYDLITSELAEDVADFIDSEEFWHAEFISEGKHYLIAADGACTSGGKFVVAELDPRKLVIRSNAAQILREDFNTCKADGEEDDELTIEQYCLAETSSYPSFYMWLFDDETISDFGTNLTDSEMKIATEFFKTL